MGKAAFRKTSEKNQLFHHEPGALFKDDRVSHHSRWGTYLRSRSPGTGRAEEAGTKPAKKWMRCVDGAIRSGNVRKRCLQGYERDVRSDRRAFVVAFPWNVWFREWNHHLDGPRRARTVCPSIGRRGVGSGLHRPAPPGLRPKPWP